MGCANDRKDKDRMGKRMVMVSDMQIEKDKPRDKHKVDDRRECVHPSPSIHPTPL